LDAVTEARGKRHEHGVYTGLAKERCRDGNGGWDADSGGLVELALMTGSDVPLDGLATSLISLRAP
jgi:hypothetical protein